MTGTSREVVETIKRRKVDIACTRQGGREPRQEISEEDTSKFYSGRPNKRNGVGIIIKED